MPRPKSAIDAMKAAAMTHLLEEELSHIPRAEKGSVQNELRMLYTYHRRRDLANDPNAPARLALFAAIRAIEAESNVVSPSFEWEFFRPGGGSAQMMRNGISPQEKKEVSMGRTVVTCRNCKRIFDSPIQFGTEESLNNSVLVGNTVTCPRCARIVPLDRSDLAYLK